MRISREQARSTTIRVSAAIALDPRQPSFLRTDRAVTMVQDDRPRRFRFRVRTLLLVVVVVALFLVVVIQQVQMGRMRQQIGVLRRSVDADAKAQDQLTTIIRDLRGHLERAQDNSVSARPYSR